VQPNAWHSIEADEVLLRLESSPQGLSTAIAQQRLAEYGPNTLPEKQQRSLLIILLGQFSDFMILVLLAAALISGLVGEPQDTIAILVIVLLNAIIGAIQEFRAERAVAALREMSAPEAHVVRDDQSVTLAAAELVLC
jgi:Ca2+-transporting ATPase